MTRLIKMLVTFLFLTAATAMSAHAQNCRSLQALEQILGSWQEKTETVLTTERWVKVSEHSFEGVGTVIESDTQSKESLRLVSMSGEIFYIAKVDQNRLPAAFKLTKCSETQFTFENPQHDFPQKITYHFVNAQRLNVRVSGGEEAEFEVNFSKLEQ